jgi:hypothetical protein
MLPSFPRKGKGRHAAFAFVKHQHTARGRRAALGAFGARAGGDK